MDAKTLCLGVLTLGDATGYEIKKHVEEGPFAHFHAAGFGSIYPALNGLHRDGLVLCTELAQEGRPDKKVYSITAAGRAAFRRALHKRPLQDAFRSESTFIMFFGHLVDQQHLTHVFEDYLDDYRTKMERMREVDLSNSPPSRRFVHGFGMAVYQACADYLAEHRALLLGDDDEPEAPVDRHEASAAE